MVRSRQQISSVLFILSILLLSDISLYAEPMRVTENLRREKVLLPASAPDKNQLTLVGFVTADEEIIATLALYDDPQTERPVDYMELYDTSGSLLMIGWVDELGVRRTAVDRGLLQEEASRLEGVFVLLPEGTPI